MSSGFVPANELATTGYFVAKHGVVALTQSIGQPRVLEDERVRVNCLCPFYVETDLIKDHVDDVRGNALYFRGHYYRTKYALRTRKGE